MEDATDQFKIRYAYLLKSDFFRWIRMEITIENTTEDFDEIKTTQEYKNNKKIRELKLWINMFTSRLIELCYIKRLAVLF